jgi:hypothetical protein
MCVTQILKSAGLCCKMSIQTFSLRFEGPFEKPSRKTALKTTFSELLAQAEKLFEKRSVCEWPLA